MAWGSTKAAKLPQALRGVRVVSLAPNLPGPAALMRLAAMGAACTKVEPPSGDPMSLYAPAFYAHLHRGMTVHAIDLKRESGRNELARELGRADVLITSSRPCALARLGLDSERLARDFPRLVWVAIVGDYAPLDELPGHDLTYQAQAGLIDAALPATLWADMAGSLLAVEAALQGLLMRGNSSAAAGQTGAALHFNVALAEAARFAALPRRFGLTAPGALLGGAHPGYQVLACADGVVTVAALEPHFLEAWQNVIGIHPELDAAGQLTLVRAWCAARSAEALNGVAQQHDLPLYAWVSEG
jgi:crotonobetainyl-CoA:carnitine CoA-transferase CaiB-like acyl-CoA transferase